MNNENELVLSSLEHTWILDLDGTIVKHNGYKIDGYDSFLDGAKEFLNNLPQNDKIIFLTSRSVKYKKITEKFLMDNNIKYDYIIYGAGFGERILINDNKPSGLQMAYAVRGKRDDLFLPKIKIDDEL